MLDQLVQLPQLFALVVFRLLGLMVFAPLIGSDRLPKPLKLYIAAAMALAMCASMATLPTPAVMPRSPWELALGIGGEIAFGLLCGLMLSFAFVAARWAGGLAGQQMGFNMAGNYHPGADVGENPVGDASFILTLFLYLAMDGHHDMVVGVRQSFDVLPPLSVGVNHASLDTFVNALAGATGLAMKLAAPTCVAMLVVDLALGMLGKTIPSLNLLSIGLSIRAIAGLLVMLLGLSATAYLLKDALDESIALTQLLWTPPVPPTAAGGA